MGAARPLGTLSGDPFASARSSKEYAPVWMSSETTRMRPGTRPRERNCVSSCCGIDSHIAFSPASGTTEVRAPTTRVRETGSTATSSYTQRGRASRVITPGTSLKSTSRTSVGTIGRSFAFFTSSVRKEMRSTYGGGSGITSGSSRQAPDLSSTLAKIDFSSAKRIGSLGSDSTRSITP